MACSIASFKDLPKLIKSKSESEMKKLQISGRWKKIQKCLKTFHGSNKAEMIELPRGGTIVKTSIGNVQFGIPPESMKDSMLLNCGIPEYYIIPTHRFHRKLGLVVADFEFPAYFQYFCNKGNQVKLITSKEGE